MPFLAFAESIQLVPDGTIFLHIAIILVMIFILNRMLFRPVNRVIEEREQRTVGRSGEAREVLSRVEENLSRYERSLREARAESYRLLEQQQAEATNNRQQKIGLVKKEVGDLIEGEKKEIQTQVENARATLGDEARRVTASVSAQILGRST